ncbi:MAG: family efflux transporter subunit, partial [Candidatus Paceibacter sp.]|nr:family efflux transporter subunit [Candidatus Paceibacter sp.]
MNTLVRYWGVSKKYLKKWWVITGIVVILLAIFFFVKGSSQPTTDEIVIVKSATVSEGVSVTGKVKAAQAVDLSFEKSGRVTKVLHNVGDQVKAGDTIVQIDNADVVAQLAQAQASLKVQQSRLNELIAGTRPEQLEITRTKMVSAQADLTVASTTFMTSLQNAYAVADDAIRNKVDILFLNPRSSNPQILFNSPITPERSLETGRVE